MDWIFYIASRGDLANLICFLLVLFLSWAQYKLYSTPNRSWEEIGWAARFGRLVLIAVTLAIFIVPLWWWLTRN
jgi:hypothetical protein